MILSLISHLGHDYTVRDKKNYGDNLVYSRAYKHKKDYE